ncbi:MAG TPA: hypothetical protein VGU22_19580 [Methylomirabilota bacterium]|nr:hypothetical protein [Methylomirabilota bacterium]
MQALTAAREKVYPLPRRDAAVMDRPTMGQQQADALALLAETTIPTASILALPPTGIRSSSTSMRRSSPTPISRGSRSSKTAHTFPRKRPGAWRATPASW